jgi:hypothetical protein
MSVSDVDYLHQQVNSQTQHMETRGIVWTQLKLLKNGPSQFEASLLQKSVQLQNDGLLANNYVNVAMVTYPEC